MIQHGTDWNRHQGVGSTLLENWVEERAVGDLIIQERADIRKLSRNGHQNILTLPSAKHDVPQSTQRDAYSLLSRQDQSKVSLGKRRQHLEAELLKRALAEVDTPHEEVAKDEWISTTKTDFSHTDLYPPVKKLGEKMPPKELLEKFEHPITFWSDHAAKGSGTAICSTSAAELHARGGLITRETQHLIGHRAGQAHQHQASAAAIGFGKHPGFTLTTLE